MNTGEIEKVEDKERLRAQIKRDLEEFLSRGGEIKQIPIIIGNYAAVTKTQSDHRRKRGEQKNRQKLEL